MNITNRVNDLFEGGGLESPWYLRYATVAAILWGVWFLNVETNIWPDWLCWLTSLFVVGYAAILAREVTLLLLAVAGVTILIKVVAGLPVGLAIIIGACIVASGCKGRGAP